MTYAVGQTVEFAFTTDPAETGTLTVTRPDGELLYPPTEGAAGAQTALLDADMAGVWRFVWESDNAGQRTGSFTVGETLVSLEDARTVAPQTPGLTVEQYDAQLAQVVQAVSEHLVRQYGAPRPGTVTRTFRHASPFVLPLGASVVSVQSGSVVLTGWDHDPDSGLLHDVRSYGPVTVTYSSTVPADVREAALLTVQHAWESRQGVTTAPFQGGVDENYTASRGFFVPNRAKELLHPYGTRVA